VSSKSYVFRANHSLPCVYRPRLFIPVAVKMAVNLALKRRRVDLLADLSDDSFPALERAAQTADSV
jgi:hypothetical protein